MTVEAAFACPGKVCFYCQCRDESCIHPGQGGLVLPGCVLHCQGAAAAAAVLAPADDSTGFSVIKSIVTALNMGKGPDLLSVPPRLE